MANRVQRLALVIVSFAGIAPFSGCSSNGSSSPGTAGHDGGGADVSPADDGSTGADTGDAGSAIQTADAAPDAATDAVVEAGGSCLAPPTPDAGVCNTLQVTGNKIPVQCLDAQAPPTPAGGTIANGTYVLTSSTYYGTCPTPEQDRITWSICGGTWQTAQESTVPNGTTMLRTYDAAVMASGNSLSIRLTCGGMQTLTFGYDASPTMLTLFTWAPTSPANGRMDVFMKQ
jgi:hypothetical protein